MFELIEIEYIPDAYSYSERDSLHRHVSAVITFKKPENVSAEKIEQVFFASFPKHFSCVKSRDIHSGIGIEKTFDSLEETFMITISSKDQFHLPGNLEDFKTIVGQRIQVFEKRLKFLIN